MIGALSGDIAAVAEEWALIDVGGVGYQVYASPRTLGAMAPGRAMRLSIETVVRDDMIRLYGFADEAERACFTRLQAVQGVGAKAALAVLNVLSPAELADAVAMEDAARVARAQGVGKKIATRIVTELKEAIPGLMAAALAPGFAAPQAGAAGAGPAADADAGDAPARLRRDAASALVNLGYDPSAAARAVAAALGRLPEGANEADVIRAALAEMEPAA
ncbi:MAG: Holliday junction branch migration protein RuvA [Pseudomonadota bacterium]